MNIAYCSTNPSKRSPEEKLSNNSIIWLIIKKRPKSRYVLSIVRGFEYENKRHIKINANAAKFGKIAELVFLILSITAKKRSNGKKD